MFVWFEVICFDVWRRLGNLGCTTHGNLPMHTAAPQVERKNAVEKALRFLHALNNIFFSTTFA